MRRDGGFAGACARQFAREAGVALVWMAAFVALGAGARMLAGWV